MQIAGSQCRVCGARIVLSSEGKFCAPCGTVVHLACEPAPVCEVCGEPYEEYEGPKADGTSDAIVPRALRSAKLEGPVLALASVLALLVMIILYCIVHSLTRGH